MLSSFLKDQDRPSNTVLRGASLLYLVLALCAAWQHDGLMLLTDLALAGYLLGGEAKCRCCDPANEL